MTNREFCYWLQGFFELSRATGLDNQQVVAIKNHLNLVRKVEQKLSEFPSWLEGFLDAAGEGLLGTGQAVEQIRTKLNAIFKHEIDPSYPGDQAELNDIHSGGGFNPGGCSHDQMIRC